MKKLIPLVIISLAAICSAQDEQTPKTTPDVAPVTSYVATVGEKLIYDARVAMQTGEIILCEQHITLQSLIPEIRLKLQAFDKEDNKLLEEIEDTWKPTPDGTIKDILDKAEDARITSVIFAQKRFRCLRVTINSTELWLVVDQNDKHVYPGVLKVLNHEDGKETVILELKQIIQPAKK